MDEEILLRFLTKEYTSEDLQIIDRWIVARPENARWLFEMEEIWSLKTGLKYSDEKEIRNAFLSFIKKTEQTRINRRKPGIKRLVYTGAAAVAAILLLLLIPVFRSIQNDAILNNLSENIDVNEINVPNGQNITVKLADGTVVWLNSGSQLIYPATFSSKNRIVKLSGEGFFEVEHNRKSPFIVMSGTVNTKVLGTKFNVKAYQNEMVRISLLEGIIEVSANGNEEVVQLSDPDQQVEIAANGTIRRSKVNSFALSQWTKGELYFENESLESITATLKRKFNVDILIRGDAYKNMVFNSRIQKDASLEDILNVLKATRNIDYSIDKDYVYIY